MDLQESQVDENQGQDPKLLQFSFNKNNLHSVINSASINNIDNPQTNSNSNLMPGQRRTKKRKGQYSAEALPQKLSISLEPQNKENLDNIGEMESNYKLATMDTENYSKITDYYKIHCVSKSSSIQQPSSSKQIKPKQQVLAINHNGDKPQFNLQCMEDQLNYINQLKEEIEKLNKRLAESQQSIREKDKYIQLIVTAKEESEKKYEIDMKLKEDYQKRARHVITAELLKNEQNMREQKQLEISHQKLRLGEYKQRRDGTKFEEVWVDGSDIKMTEKLIKNIENDIDQLYLEIKKVKKTQGTASKVGEDSNSICSDLTVKEQKNRIKYQINILEKQLSDLRQKQENLRHEKLLFLQQLKKDYEEQNCRFAYNWPQLDNRYQLLCLLGRGGFSEVYKAYDLNKFDFTACKIHQLNPNWSEIVKQNYIKHAIRESKIHSELQHPNIVKLYDTVEIDNNSFCTVLEYCEGPDLQLYLKENKQIPEKEAKILIKQIVAGLKYIHNHKTKIIHYDLKPQNLIFHKGELKITDFGLCKLIENDATRVELTSQGVGTYWYLPPETFVQGDKPPEISPKVDVWSMGVIFYQMLYGDRPFGNDKNQNQILKEQIILKSTKVVFPSKPVISEPCRTFIQKCLTYDQSQRWDINEAYQSAYLMKN